MPLVAAGVAAAAATGLSAPVLLPGAPAAAAAAPPAAPCAPSLEEGEYYHRDVLGLEVRHGDRVLGRVVAIHSTGPVDVWTVLGDQGERFVPATSEFVVAVKLEEGVIEVEV